MKVVTCREIVQESMIKSPLTPTSAKVRNIHCCRNSLASLSQALGEVFSCCLLIGSGLKDKESLQINLVGTGGLKNVMAITDSGTPDLLSTMTTRSL